MLRPKLNLNRRLRLAIFEAFSRLSEHDFSVDQIMAAQMPELLALSEELNPSYFQPAKLSPGAVANDKANSYVANYLAGQFVYRINRLGLPSSMTEAAIVNSGDFMIAQLQRLQLNYNTRLTVADYLANLTVRDGLLAKLSAKLSTSLVKESDDIVNLSGQVGESMGIAGALIDEMSLIHKSKNYFINLVTAGHYPLPMLFAMENNRQWFDQFLHSTHRPNQEAFTQAYQFTMGDLTDTQDIVNDRLKQLRLDIKLFPNDDCQTKLTTIVNDLSAQLKQLK